MFICEECTKLQGSTFEIAEYVNERTSPAAEFSENRLAVVSVVVSISIRIGGSYQPCTVIALPATNKKDLNACRCLALGFTLTTPYLY